jgi:tripartite-type tricarboxylate transporter receptor subunit TctC
MDFTTSRAHSINRSTRGLSVRFLGVTTVDQEGVPDFYMSVWHGLWAPKGTPKNLIARLNAAVVETLADATVRKRLDELGYDIPPVEQQTPDALGAYQKAEIEKWWPIIRGANIKVE